MKGFCLTYDSGKGIFGFCGFGDYPPFNKKGRAVIFSTRREAREALKRFRELKGVTNLKPCNANNYRIVASHEANIKNR